MLTFESRTLAVLKNFAAINKSIYIREGNILSTMAPSRAVLARTEVAENFPTDFGIYDLTRFLGTISLLGDPEIEFDDTKLVLRQDRKKVDYALVSPDVITVPPAQEMKFPEPYVSFSVSQEVLAGVLKASGVLELPEVAIVGKDGRTFFQAFAAKNPSSDVYSVDVGESAEDFLVVIKRENMVMMPGAYQVEVAKNDKGSRLAKFTGTENGIIYYVAVDSNSST